MLPPHPTAVRASVESKVTIEIRIGVLLDRRA
jgi:hypothetical protein